MSTEFKTKIDKWLRDIGCTPVDQDDPQAEWHLIIDYPAKSGHHLHVAAPQGQADRVVILSGTEVSHEHLQAFEKLDDEGKEDFLWRLRHTVNTLAADFMLDGAHGPLECPTRFKISATRYEDGLTLDSFAQSVGAVYKTELSAIWVIQQYLSPRSFGSGGRFDFKRLGL